ncbi:hypothetical protein [Catellatospora methionotrophica]|uniref:hypothetical protein n=1 Tax=Catellatospora methionotrophica TaxID=121620 RepID=UPI003407A924
MVIILSTKDHFLSLSGHPQLDHFRHALTRVVAGHGCIVGQSIISRVDQSAELRQLFAFGRVDLFSRGVALLIWLPGRARAWRGRRLSAEAQCPDPARRVSAALTSYGKFRQLLSKRTT